MEIGQRMRALRQGAAAGVVIGVVAGRVAGMFVSALP